MAHAEYTADPERWDQYGSTGGLRREYNHLRQADKHESDAPHHESKEATEEVEEDLHRHRSIASSSVGTTVSTTRDNGSSRRRVSRMDSALTVSRTSTGMEGMVMEYLERHPTAIKRIQEHRLTHSMTVGSTKTGTTTATVLPEFGGGKPYPAQLPDREEYVVEFNGHDDPKHAQNWPMKKKVVITCILMFDALAATFASSIFSPTSAAVGAHFHVGKEVTVLGTSLCKYIIKCAVFHIAIRFVHHT